MNRAIIAGELPPRLTHTDASAVICNDRHIIGRGFGHGLRCDVV